ncbi:MAG: hypothetical protein AMXMBFR36_37600 [Acidobacteriota bacterium]
MIRRLALAAGLALVGSTAPLVAQDLLVYDNQLRNGFQDWSWATRNLAFTGQSHSAPNSIQMEPDGWAGLYFHSDTLQDVGDFVDLRLWVKGQSGGGQQLTLLIQSNGATRASVALSDFVTGGISGSQWRQAIVAFAAIGLTNGTFNEITLQDATGGNQAAVLFDDVLFSADPTPPGPIAVDVDPNADRRPVSDLIYGVNFASPAQLADVGYPLNRWGGNRTTRYHWQLDVDNSAFDWFYQNYTGSEGQPLPQGSSSDQFITSTRAAGADVVLTLPSMGRVAGPDRQRRWSFSQSLYGPQLQDECSYFPPPAPGWCQPDAGNGLCDPDVNTTGFCSPAGRIVGNDPDDTSIPVGPAFVESWLDFVATRVGPAGGGGVRFAALDNEPMLWNSTHADVHPAPATYAEVWQRGRDVAAAVKAGHPGIKILGPDTWGWCDLWTSAADVGGVGDDCTDGPDRQAHGGVPFVRWYLGQVCAYQQQNGVRLVDYVDVHYYPQSGEAFGGEQYAAIRLDSIRELDSPTYVSQSWIGANVRLIPRLKEWIAQACPGTRIAITEYAWGADDAPSAALAQAEVLAIFGREGVDLATRWVVPETGTRTEDSFRFFLDYDGAGARVAGESVSTVSSDLDEVGAYAVRGPSDQLYVLLFNKETAARDVDVDVAAAVSGPAALWRFTPASPLGSAGTVPVAGNGFTLTLPARSATVAVLDIVSDLIFRDGVDSGATRNWSLVSP